MLQQSPYPAFVSPLHEKSSFRGGRKNSRKRSLALSQATEVSVSYEFVLSSSLTHKCVKERKIISGSYWQYLNLVLGIILTKILGIDILYNFRVVVSVHRVSNSLGTSCRTIVTPLTVL